MNDDGKREAPPSLRDLPQDQPIFIADLARAFRWRTERMRRKLFSIHTKHDDPVVIKIGGRWALTSINRLRQAWHGVGERGLTVEELSEMLEQTRTQLRDSLERNRELRTEITRLRARQRATEERVVQVEESFVKATQSLMTPTRLERPIPSFAEETESGTHLVEGASAPAAKRSG
jgi:hypothetical protein